jgi:hypothetical protein
MVDEIFDRNYQDGRTQLNAGIDRGFAHLRRELVNSWTALQRITWSAPWQAPAPRSNRKHVGHA